MLGSLVRIMKMAVGKKVTVVEMDGYDYKVLTIKDDGDSELRRTIEEGLAKLGYKLRLPSTCGGMVEVVEDTTVFTSDKAVEKCVASIVKKLARQMNVFDTYGRWEK